jgi:prolyl-tRNA synthetase
MGADPGSLGPVGVAKDLPIYADIALDGRKNLICGANRDDFHLKHVTPGKDFTADFVDLRSVTEGETCPQCSKGSLKVAKAIEIGHIFKLGLKYSQSMGATVLDQNGDEKPIVMGSYGIGIGRVLATAVELFNDKDGMILAPSIAPFQVILTLLRPDDQEHQAIAEKIYGELEDRGIDCLLDDRKERPGVKFKDADLIGIPVRVTLGKKLTENQVEIFRRVDKDLQVVDLDSAIDGIEQILRDYPI